MTFAHATHLDRACTQDHTVSTMGSRFGPICNGRDLHLRDLTSCTFIELELELFLVWMQRPAGVYGKRYMPLPTMYGPNAQTAEMFDMLLCMLFQKVWCESSKLLHAGIVPTNPEPWDCSPQNMGPRWGRTCIPSVSTQGHPQAWALPALDVHIFNMQAQITVHIPK